MYTCQTPKKAFDIHASYIFPISQFGSVGIIRGLLISYAAIVLLVAVRAILP